ncbi:nucleoside/nucleotide kinase family protein [Paenibacillus chitinolyticus]|uniref:hypothetical protein n=1 Tax=Paenibacillus chitinolyticus TaxID=79263 RepID=UPI003671D731
MGHYGLGNLYNQLKEMESMLREYERRIIDYTINNDKPIKEVADEIIKEYRKIKVEYEGWMSKVLYEKEE